MLILGTEHSRLLRGTAGTSLPRDRLRLKKWLWDWPCSRHFSRTETAVLVMITLGVTICVLPAVRVSRPLWWDRRERVVRVGPRLGPLKRRTAPESWTHIFFGRMLMSHLSHWHHGCHNGTFGGQKAAWKKGLAEWPIQISLKDCVFSRCPFLVHPGNPTIWGDHTLPDP